MDPRYLKSVQICRFVLKVVWIYDTLYRFGILFFSFLFKLNFIVTKFSTNITGFRQFSMQLFQLSLKPYTYDMHDFTCKTNSTWLQREMNSDHIRKLKWMNFAQFFFLPWQSYLLLILNIVYDNIFKL